jgi:hypothetical protein
VRNARSGTLAALAGGVRFLYLCSAVCWFVSSSPAQNSTEIPFRFQDGLIWLDVSVAGQSAQFQFVLDSGAGQSVLNSQAAQRIGLALKDSDPISGVTGLTMASRADGFDGALGGCKLPRTILVLDLEPVSALCRQRIDGLVGLDFFENRVIQIDFTAEKVRLLSHSDFIRTGGQILQLARRNDAVCLRAAVNGASPQWMRLDTGCDGGLHWVSAKSHLWRASPKVAAGLGDSPELLGAQVQIGAEHWFERQTWLHRREIFPSERGLIGNGVLSKFLVTIDLAGKRVVLDKAARRKPGEFPTGPRPAAIE